MAHLQRPALEEIRAAAAKISDILVNAPLAPLGPPDSDVTILLKPEILQTVGSFKIRGVFNAVASMSEETRRRGLSTVSAGNTAQALAWTGRHFGVPVRSIMPEHAPTSKVEAVRAYGGEPILVPTEEVFRFLREHGWENEPYAFIHKVESFLPPRALHIASVAEQSERAVLASLASLANRGAP